MIDLTDAAYWRDPYPVLERARAAGRTTVTQTGEPAVLSARDAETLHTDPHFSTPGLSDLKRIGIHDGPFYEWRARTLNVMNGADHDRLRSYVSRAFMPRQIDRLRGLVRDRTNALLDRASGASSMDFVTDFATDLPLWTMCRFLGIEEDDRLRIGAFLTGTEEGFTQRMTPEIRARVEASILALNDYVAELIERRTAEPRDDIVSALVTLRRSGEGPGDDEMLALAVNIIGGSVGSTRAALANAILLFAEHPAQAALLAADPGLARRAVEECLRLHPPFRVARRAVVAPVAAFGLDLVPGDTVFVPKQACNRDPERWDDPHRFDILRPERRHLSFGAGPHFCLGAAIARANLQESIPIVLQRLERLTVIGRPARVPFTMDEQLEGFVIGWDRVGPDMR